MAIGCLGLKLATSQGNRSHSMCYRKREFNTDIACTCDGVVEKLNTMLWTELCPSKIHWLKHCPPV